MRPLVFREDAVGLLIKALRKLSRLKWLKVACPKCRGGDDAISHAPGRGAGEGRFFGDDLQLLPEEYPAGCEDV